MKIFSPILKGTTTVAQGTTNLSGSFTGSLLGTAATASYADNFTVGGTLTAQTINVQIITSSIEFNTGSTRNGSSTANTHQFTGSILMSGSLSVVTTGTELQVNAGGVNIGNALTDNHIISGSFGINTNALFVSSSGNTGLGVINPASRLHVIGDITQQTSLNASAQFFLILRKSRGTVDTPLTVNVNDEAGGILFTGYDGTTWRNGAAIRAKVQSVTTGTLSSNLEFFAGNGAPSVGTQVLTMRGDTQNVGIGTTSPNNRLEIRNDVNGDLAFWINNRAITASGTSNSIIFGGYRDAEDPFAVGKISVIHAGGSSGDLNHKGDMVFYTQQATPSTLGERMRINALGFTKASNAGSYRSGASLGGHEFSDNVSTDINHFTIYASSTSTLGNLLRVVSDRGTTNGTYNLISASGTTNEFSVRDSGNCVNTNGSYGAISDIRLKENIVDTSPKLEDLLKVKIRNYNLKTEPSLKQIGVIAQELEEIFPGMIEETLNRETNETTKSVKYSVFVPMLIKAIQELSAKNTSLEERLTALENN
jgi:hypothetical protein